MEPDILFVRQDRADILSERGVVCAPDLAVEVRSPSTRGRDRGVKLERYRHFAVADDWIIDPDTRTLDVWRLADGATSPVTHRIPDTLRWEPVSDGPTLEIALKRYSASSAAYQPTA